MPAQRTREIVKKIEVMRTPVHASRLNIAECELSVLNRQGLESRIESEQQLKTEVFAWNEYRNKKHKGVDWQFTPNRARVKLKRLYPGLLDPGMQ